jgi:hypothetical protein
MSGAPRTWIPNPDPSRAETPLRFDGIVERFRRAVKNDFPV